MKPIMDSRTVGECQDRINKCMQLLDDLTRLYRFSWERLTAAIDDGIVPSEELNALILNDHTRFYHLSFEQLTAAIDDGIVLPEELDALKQHGSSCVYLFSGQFKKTLQGMISLLEDFNLKNDFPLGDNWNWIKTQWAQLKDEYA